MAKTHTKIQQNSQTGPLEPSPLPPAATRGLIERPNHNWGIDLSTPMDRCPTNLDLTTKRGRALLASAAGIQDYRLQGKDHIVIKATNYIAYASEMEDEKTGEMTVRKVTCLIDADGKIYKTTGFAAFDVLRAAAVLYTAEEWERGINFVISWKDMPSGHRAHDVRVLIDADDVIGPPSEPQ